MSNRSGKDKQRNAINKQLEQPRARTMEKDDNLIQLGKFFYTLAGMTYAGVVITVLIDYNDDKVGTLAFGTLATVLLAVLAWILVKRGNIKK